MRRLIFSVICAALLGGCAGTKVNWDAARSLKAGMSKTEVTDRLGSPNSVTSAGGREIWVWSHYNGMTGSSRSLSVIFQDGKMMEPPKIPDSF